MTVDERIERLTERTQAIAESLELVVIQVRELGHSIDKDAENIRALARIAEIHEHRLTHLEGGNPA
jgi:methyl-accepting chemotaxis protein